MKTMATQFGISCNADFEENQWGFNMPENFQVRAGEFAIVDKQVYDEMLECLNEFVVENIVTAELRERSKSVIEMTKKDEE